MTDDRYASLTAFASQFGCDLATLHIIAGDASNRKYYRATQGTRAVILMDAPPEKGEDVRPFVQIAGYLRQVGLHAPEILDADLDKGFLALEDLGDTVFARVLAADTAPEADMYQAATDVLVHLHQQALAPLPRYDAPLMADVAGLSIEWYRRGITGTAECEGAADVQNLFQTTFEKLKGEDVVVHRDYHAENLIWVPGRAGLARVGILDFQDALLGPPAYDLVSILQDARRDVSTETETAMIQYYCRERGLAEDTFRQSYHLCGLQRNLRILGIFARLSMRDHKPQYIGFLPRVWEFVERNLAALSDEALTQTITSTLPEPTPEKLTTLRQVTV